MSGDESRRFYVADPDDPRNWCAGWNRAHAPGSRVLYAGRVHTTSSIATVVGGHTAVVHLDDVAGPVPLAHVLEAPADARTPDEHAAEDWQRRERERGRAELVAEYRRNVWVAFGCALLGAVVAVCGASDLFGPHWLRGVVILVAGLVFAAASTVALRVMLVRLDDLGVRRPWIFRTKAGGL